MIITTDKWEKTKHNSNLNIVTALMYGVIKQF
jgi:hypothetical protein